MKKVMDKMQAESKKLKMSFYNVNKEKVAYEKFVKDFIKSLEKDSIVRVVNGNTEASIRRRIYLLFPSDETIGPPPYLSFRKLMGLMNCFDRDTNSDSRKKGKLCRHGRASTGQKNFKKRKRTESSNRTPRNHNSEFN